MKPPSLQVSTNDANHRGYGQHLRKLNQQLAELRSASPIWPNCPPQQVWVTDVRSSVTVAPPVNQSPPLSLQGDSSWSRMWGLKDFFVPEVFGASPQPVPFLISFTFCVKTCCTESLVGKQNCIYRFNIVSVPDVLGLPDRLWDPVLTDNITQMTCHYYDWLYATQWEDPPIMLPLIGYTLPVSWRYPGREHLSTSSSCFC